MLEVGNGPAVLFLQGGPIAGATWAYVAAHVRDVRCLLLDRPGTGLGPARAAVPGVDELPRYVEQLTHEVLDIERRVAGEHDTVDAVVQRSR